MRSSLGATELRFGHYIHQASGILSSSNLVQDVCIRACAQGHSVRCPQSNVRSKIADTTVVGRPTLPGAFSHSSSPPLNQQSWLDHGSHSHVTSADRPHRNLAWRKLSFFLRSLVHAGPLISVVLYCPCPGTETCQESSVFYPSRKPPVAECMILPRRSKRKHEKKHKELVAVQRRPSSSRKPRGPSLSCRPPWHSSSPRRVVVGQPSCARSRQRPWPFCAPPVCVFSVSHGYTSRRDMLDSV